MIDLFFPDGNSTFGLLKHTNVKLEVLRVTLYNSHFV